MRTELRKFAEEILAADLSDRVVAGIEASADFARRMAKYSGEGEQEVLARTAAAHAAVLALVPQMLAAYTAAFAREEE